MVDFPVKPGISCKKLGREGRFKIKIPSTDVEDTAWVHLRLCGTAGWLTFLAVMVGHGADLAAQRSCERMYCVGAKISGIYTLYIYPDQVAKTVESEEEEERGRGRTKQVG